MSLDEEQMSAVSPASSLVAHLGGRWLWFDPNDAVSAEELDHEELVRRLEVDSEPDSREASGEQDMRPIPVGWVGTVESGCVRGRLHGRDVVLTSSQLGRWSNSTPAGGFGAGLSSSDASARRRAPLRDEAASATLLHDGWVTMDLLSPTEVQHLRDEYERLHGWEGAGFEPDPANPDFGYRAEVARVLAVSLGDRLDEVFADFTPFIWSYYCKWPDTPAIHLHWDWSCADERQGHRCYQVWIALQDTDEHNGQIAVLPYTHRGEAGPRGTGLSIPLSASLAARYEEAIAETIPVPLRAGQGIIFDMGLVHISTPNSTDRPRLAAVSSWHPSEAPLQYFRRYGERLALRYDVDARWYNNMVPETLHELAPAFPPSELIAVEPEGPPVDQHGSSSVESCAAPPDAGHRRSLLSLLGRKVKDRAQHRSKTALP